MAPHPVEILAEEHEVILQVLTAVERKAAETRPGAPLDKGFWSDVIDFIVHFADRCHHGKEEDMLFPTMCDHGFSRQQGPVAVMIEEHKLGREFTRQMAEGVKAGDAARVVRAALGYAALLRDHIGKENTILFELARQSLPPAAVADLLARFERFEHDVLGAAMHGRYVEAARRLCQRAGVPPEAAATRHPGSGGRSGP